ncbi:MAG: LysR family transcriptional regulator [Kiloniellales bacterium]|nr:LysR family transcriptional regulator [Kiloniellales bacterium]
MNWDDLRFFAALASAGNLAAAARRLESSPATVWRRVTALEARLETRLFEQRRNPYAPSPAGRRLLETVERMEAELAAATADLGGLSDEVGGEARVTAPEFLGAAVIAESLGRLAEAHPLLRVELVTASPTASLAQRETDLALRFERPQRGGFQAVAGFAVGFGIYAAPAYLDRRSRPASPFDLEGHAVIDFDESQGHAAPARWLSRSLRKARIVFRSNSLQARRAAGEAGLGLLLLPSITGDRTPGLERLWSGAELGRLELLLLVNESVGRAPRVRVLRDHLLATLEAESEALAG